MAKNKTGETDSIDYKSYKAHQRNLSREVIIILINDS
jgi:hypothetical protein